MAYEEYKKKKLNGNPTLKAEYIRLTRRRSLMYSLAKQIKEQRLKLKLTQKGLAQRVGTHQSGIARLENGSTLPSLSFLLVVAEALELGVKINLTSYIEVKDEIKEIKPLNLQNNLVQFKLIDAKTRTSNPIPSENK